MGTSGSQRRGFHRTRAGAGGVPAVGGRGGVLVPQVARSAVSALRGWSEEPRKSVETRWNGIGVVRGWSPARTGQVCERISAQTPWIHPGPKIRFRFGDSESEYGLGMRQPAHGCNARAKRLAHCILTFLRCDYSRVVLFALCQQDWLAITAADLRQARPVCSPDESRSRRCSARASRSMPEPPSTKDSHDEGAWIRRDLPSCFLASLGFTFARCAYANERTAHEVPRLHRRKLRWHKPSICKPRIGFQKVRYIF
jgi:hypothetical protein